MRKFKIIALLIATFVALPLVVCAQTPYFSPIIELTNPDGELTTNESVSGSGPYEGVFKANPKEYEGWTALFEWCFVHDGEKEPYLIRYDEDTEVTFAEYGKTYVYCCVKFVNGNDTISYDKQYWNENVGEISISVAESKLEMPNAFSPNGDEFNEIYKPKKGYKSIIEFHAIIFNRYGQKLYEWNDPSTGWDGTYNGKPVKEGVYYCLVRAKGADGEIYNIKKDVNLLRGFTEPTKEITE